MAAGKVRTRSVKYYQIIVEDVNELLLFAMKPEGDFQDEIQEEKRVKEELQMFQDILERNLRQHVKYIGEEKSYGKYLERFLLDHGGFMEIIIEQPLVMKVHFMHRDRAVRFLKGLKKTLREIIPEADTKDMFIDNIDVEEVEHDPLPIDKWAKMHHIYLQRSVVFTIVAIIIVALFEVIKAGFELISLELFGMSHSASVTIIGAVAIAFMFEPIKKRTEKIVDTYMFR